MSSHYLLFRYKKDIDSILSTIETSNLPIDFPVRFLFLISDSDVFKIVKSRTPANFLVNITDDSDSILTIKLTREMKRNKKYTITADFQLIKLPDTNIYVALISGKQKHIRLVIMRYFEHYYSHISRLFLNSKQLEDLLDIIKNKLDCSIITDQVVSYSRLRKKNLTYPVASYRMREASMRWTEEDYKISFQKESESDLDIDKITFFARKEEKLLFHAGLAREGLFRCNKNALSFYKVVIQYLMNVGNKKIKIFSNKSIIDNKGKIQPISIMYKNNIFADKDQFKKLARCIAELPNSSNSVYHGNPYLHMSLVDYMDGSSYEIWVVSQEKIIIIPQLRSTFKSISRLCEHVMKKFQEGELEELVVS